MILTELITIITTGIIKPFIAAVLALLLTVANAVPGNYGEYMRLETKALTFNPALAKTEITVEADLGRILEIYTEYSSSESEESEVPDLSELSAVLEENGIPGELKDGVYSLQTGFNVYTDLDNLRLMIDFSPKQQGENVVWLDAEGLTLSPGLTGSLAALSPESAQSAAYTKHLAGRGLYLSFDSVFGGLQADTSIAITMQLQAISNIILNLLGDPSFIENIIEIQKLQANITEKYIKSGEKDGATVYSYEMNGSELLEFLGEVMQLQLSEDYIALFANQSLAFSDALMGETSEMSPEEYELYKASVLQSITEQYTLQAQSYESFTDELNEFLNMAGNELFSALIKDSYLYSEIYEKDGVIYKTEEICIKNGEEILVYVKCACEFSKYDGEITASANALTLEQRFTLQDLENKVAFDTALEKGVGGIYLSWDSAMSPENSVLNITNPGFYVAYNTKLPENTELTEEQKMKLSGYFGPEGCEVELYASNAQLIDNSVYLPLRQITECAGYEVSWDAEASKAYVTVDGEKIEMTGVIIDNRTYVKLRDFEKLGAVIEYDETMYYEKAYNDFAKTCYATVSFASAE